MMTRNYLVLNINHNTDQETDQRTNQEIDQNNLIQTTNSNKTINLNGLHLINIGVIHPDHTHFCEGITYWDSSKIKYITECELKNILAVTAEILLKDPLPKKSLLVTKKIQHILTTPIINSLEKQIEDHNRYLKLTNSKCKKLRPDFYELSETPKQESEITNTILKIYSGSKNAIISGIDDLIEVDRSKLNFIANTSSSELSTTIYAELSNVIFPHTLIMEYNLRKKLGKIVTKIEQLINIRNQQIQDKRKSMGRPYNRSQPIYQS